MSDCNFRSFVLAQRSTGEAHHRFNQEASAGRLGLLPRIGRINTKVGSLGIAH